MTITAFDQRTSAIAAYPKLELFIDGSWVAERGHDASGVDPTTGADLARGANFIDVIDPTTGLALGHLPSASEPDVEQAIVAAERSFATWRNVPAMERGRYLREAVSWLRARRAQWASLISLELGKPYAEALRETETACEMFEWAAEEARRLYGRLIPPRVSDMRMMAIPMPIGPVAAISGWNAPSITPARKIAAALGAGCTIVIKPSEATPATALMIAKAFEAVDLPRGVLNMLFGDPPTIAERFATDPRLRMITFTGGTEVGKRLASLAAASLKRSVFELGGHAPAMVFADCDVEAVAATGAATKFRNSGQICTSPTRFLVEAPVYDRFVAAFAAAANNIVVGDPFDNGVQMGPMQNARRVSAISDLILDATAHGAKIVTGGAALDRAGFFHAATILVDVPKTARATYEEPFGTLAMVDRFEGVDAAIAEANRLPFGLAAYAFTNDLRVSDKLARNVQAGTFAINHWTASLAETPFGGVKDSGVGSEGGIEGLAAFQQVRFVSVAT